MGDLLRSESNLDEDKSQVIDQADYVHRCVMIDAKRRFWPVGCRVNVFGVMLLNKMVVRDV